MWNCIIRGRGKFWSTAGRYFEKRLHSIIRCAVCSTFSGQLQIGVGYFFILWRCFRCYGPQVLSPTVFLLRMFRAFKLPCITNSAAPLIFRSLSYSPCSIFLLLFLLYTLFLYTMFNYSPYQTVYTNFNETDLQSTTRVCNFG